MLCPLVPKFVYSAVWLLNQHSCIVAIIVLFTYIKECVTLVMIILKKNTVLALYGHCSTLNKYHLCSHSGKLQFECEGFLYCPATSNQVSVFSGTILEILKFDHYQLHQFSTFSEILYM